MKKEHVKLSEKDRVELKGLLKQNAIVSRTYKRALALMELDRGKTYTEVSQSIGVTKQTVSVWAKKYRASGLDCLTDQPRPGRPTIIDGLQRAKITVLACSDPPAGYARWSLRLLADKAVEKDIVERISHSGIAEILKKTNSSLTASATGASEK